MKIPLSYEEKPYPLNAVLQALWSLHSFEAQLGGYLNPEEVCQGAPSSRRRQGATITENCLREDALAIARLGMREHSGDSNVYMPHPIMSTSYVPVKTLGFHRKPVKGIADCKDSMAACPDFLENLSTIDQVLYILNQQQLHPLAYLRNIANLSVFCTVPGKSPLPLLQCLPCFRVPITSTAQASKRELRDGCGDLYAGRKHRMTKNCIDNKVGLHSDKCAQYDLEPSLGTQDACLHCMVKNLFAYFEFGGKQAAESAPIRFALSKAFTVQNTYIWKTIRDADVLLELMMQIIHGTYIVESKGMSILGTAFVNLIDCSCNMQCLAHDVFGIELLDMLYCSKCKSGKDVGTRKSYVYPIKANDLLQAIKETSYQKNHEAVDATGIRLEGHSRSFPFKTKSLEECLKIILKTELTGKLNYEYTSRSKAEFGGQGSSWTWNFGNDSPSTKNTEYFKSRCESCGSTARGVYHRYCVNAPKVLAYSLNWDDEIANAPNIKYVLSTIYAFFCLQGVFKPIESGGLDTTFDGESFAEFPFAPFSHYHVFRGMICFSAQLSYITFFFDWKSNCWNLYDNAVVEEYSSWSEVVEECERGLYAPKILFFENFEIILTANKAEIRKGCKSLVSADGKEVLSTWFTVQDSMNG